MINQEYIKHLLEELPININYNQYKDSFYNEFDEMIEDWQKFVEAINNKNSNFLVLIDQITIGNLTNIGIFSLLDFIIDRKNRAFKFEDEKTRNFLLIRECIYHLDSLTEYNKTGFYSNDLPKFANAIDYKELARLHNIIISNVYYDGKNYGVIYDQSLINKLVK